MKQVVRLLSTYSADLFGISSVLYELGGLVVMHDASGCNSTYNTHDEPRWYTMESMVYISGFVENDVILGNDDKLINDICEVARETEPRFIAISAAMIAHFMGVDIRGVSRIIEKRTGIPAFAFDTNAMNTYISGGNMAYRALIDRFCPDQVASGECERADESGCENECENEREFEGENEHENVRESESDKSGGKASDKISVNLLGITPLDFSIVGNVEALHRILEDAGIRVNCCMTMGCTIDDIARAGDADVNILCSSIAEDGAKLLHKKYGTPVVTGLPVGIAGTAAWIDAIRESAGDGVSRKLADQAAEMIWTENPAGDEGAHPIYLIGEPVFTTSLRYCLENDFGLSNVRVICPTERTLGLLRTTDIHDKEEDTLEELLPEASMIIADPIYRRVLKKDSKVHFINLPHEAYSGRMYRSHIPVFLGPEMCEWLGDAFGREEVIEVNDIMKLNRPFAERVRY